MDRDKLISELELILDCLKYMSLLSHKKGLDNKLTCTGCINELKAITDKL